MQHVRRPPTGGGIWPVLTDTLLDGPVPTSRQLTPPQVAHFVAEGDLGAAVDAVRAACGMWGGAYNPVVPVDPGPSLAAFWHDLVNLGQLDAAEFQNSEWRTNLLDELGIDSWTVAGWGVSLLSVLARIDERRLNRQSILVADGLNPRDPWYVAYAGALGLRPKQPDSSELSFARLIEGTDYGDLVTYEPCTTDGGSRDLLARLCQPDAMTQAQLTTVPLPVYAAPRNLGTSTGNSILAHKFQLASNIGPNIVVVYSPGSAADLALIWHLRALHGLQQGFPLAVPDTEDVEEVLRYWCSEGAMLRFGAHRTRHAVTSLSIPSHNLEALVKSSPQFAVVEPSFLIQPPVLCGIRSADVSLFQQGVAPTPPVTPAEQALLPHEILAQTRTSMRLTVSFVGRELPPSKTMARSSTGHWYCDGSVSRVGSDTAPRSVRYPSGLEVLKAIALDHGMRCQPSKPGLLAEHFLRSVGGIFELDPLLSREALTLMRKLAARSGTSLIKSRLDRLTKDGALLGVDGLSRDEVTSRLVETLGTPDVADVRALTHGFVSKALGGRLTGSAWLRWAVQKRLVIRGVAVRCGECQSREWRPFADVAGQVYCSSCGLEVIEPFGVENLNFQYRASRPTIQVVDSGLLPHLLAMRFLLMLYTRDDRQGLIYGAYPGVEFLEMEGDTVIGEADVVLVTSDGRLVLGECKDSSAGLTDDELQKIVRLGERLDAVTFAATLDEAKQCPPIWRDSLTASHFCLTSEHLLEPLPIHLAGSPSPLEWRESHIGRMSGEPVPYEQIRHEYHQLLTGSPWYADDVDRAPWVYQDQELI